MKLPTLPKLVTVLGAAALWTLMSPAPAAASIVLDFTELPNEGGITAAETGGRLGFTGILTVSGETIQLSDFVGANFSGHRPAQGVSLREGLCKRNP